VPEPQPAANEALVIAAPIRLQADRRETPDVLVALSERRVRGNAVLTVP
jgi:hypothetical protein